MTSCARADEIICAFRIGTLGDNGSEPSSVRCDFLAENRHVGLHRSGGGHFSALKTGFPSCMQDA